MQRLSSKIIQIIKKFNFYSTLAITLNRPHAYKAANEKGELTTTSFNVKAVIYVARLSKNVL
jgi:hypothetical protein